MNELAESKSQKFMVEHQMRHLIISMRYCNELAPGHNVLYFIIDSYCPVKGMKKFTVEIYFTLIYREMLLILL